MDNNDILLEVKNLKKHFPVKKSFLGKSTQCVKAVDGVTFSIKKGETLGLVGESGCGKSTTGRSILRLIEPTAGSVFFDGQDILALDKNKLRNMRKYMQIIFQDPYASLNPRLTAGEIIGRAIATSTSIKGEEREKQIYRLFDVVGLDRKYYNRYPNEFSGGQRQRIGIARALSCNPKLIVCDEAVSALDVSIQAQIINLLRDIQKEFKLTYLFISHNLAVVKHISDNIAVMYLGKIVESAPKQELFNKPIHPYTKALLSAILSPNPRERVNRIKLNGDISSPLDMPEGCRFHNRCAFCEEKCKEKEVQLEHIGNNHYVACYRR